MREVNMQQPFNPPPNEKPITENRDPGSYRNVSRGASASQASPARIHLDYGVRSVRARADRQFGLMRQEILDRRCLGLQRILQRHIRELEDAPPSAEDPDVESLLQEVRRRRIRELEWVLEIARACALDPTDNASWRRFARVLGEIQAAARHTCGGTADGAR